MIGLREIRPIWHCAAQVTLVFLNAHIKALIIIVIQKSSMMFAVAAMPMKATTLRHSFVSGYRKAIYRCIL
jgi:hypothetical protein